MKSSIYVEDLKENTNYSVKLSYPGVIPVQYEVFLEMDEASPNLHRSVHQRRIQDTRLFSFRTDERGRIVKNNVEEDGTTHIVVEIKENNGVGVLSSRSSHHPQTPGGRKSSGEDSRPVCHSRCGACRDGNDTFSETGESWILELLLMHSCPDWCWHRCTIWNHILQSQFRFSEVHS